MKKILMFFAVLALLATSLVACSGRDSGSTGSTDAPNTVHMNETQFVPNTITIKKGDKVNLVNDVAVVHIIQNGAWDDNGNVKTMTEPGAPRVNLQFNGNDSNSIGPFTTAGTFHVYCTVHSGMNLTVVVQ